MVKVNNKIPIEPLSANVQQLEATGRGGLLLLLLTKLHDCHIEEDLSERRTYNLGCLKIFQTTCKVGSFVFILLSYL